MPLLFAIEASRPDGTRYRMAFAWMIPAKASWFSVFRRLF